MKHQLTVIAANRTMNSFMVAADVFERGKVLGCIQTVSFESETKYDDEKIKQLIDLTKQGFEESGQHVSFISFDSLPSLPYWDTTVRIISTGSKWYMLDDWIRTNYPMFEVKTDQYRFITEIVKKF